MGRVSLVTYDSELFLENIQKALGIIDKSDLSEKRKEKIHELIDQETSPRYMFLKKSWSWQDILLALDNIVPPSADEYQVDRVRQTIEEFVGYSPNSTPKHSEEYKATEKSHFVEKKVDSKVKEKAETLEDKKPFYIKKMGDVYFIFECFTNRLLDNNFGFGFENYNKAIKTAFYKYGGGKERIDKSIKWWKDNLKVLKKVKKYLYEYEIKPNTLRNLKCDDTITIIKEVKRYCKKKNIEGFEEEFLRWVPNAFEELL